jgi:hypothetical protein
MVLEGDDLEDETAGPMGLDFAPLLAPGLSTGASTMR